MAMPIMRYFHPIQKCSTKLAPYVRCGRQDEHIAHGFVCALPFPEPILALFRAAHKLRHSDCKEEE
jgi:hypothetical protein